MNRQRCEALAHERALIQDDAYQTVDDEVIKGPGPYDSHVSVEALPSPVPRRTTSGHVLLYGAYMKKCLFLHYETPLRQGEDEETLSARLAVVRLQVLGGIRVDSFDKPDARQTR
jgi:hypothetical protein